VSRHIAHFFVVFLILTSQAFAGTLRCNRCSNAQMRRVTEQAGVGHHVVLDIPGGNIFSANVICEHAFAAATFNADATKTSAQSDLAKCKDIRLEEVPLTTAFTYAAKALQRFWQESAGSMRLRHDVSIPKLSITLMAMPGFEFATSKVAQNAVRDALKNNPRQWDGLAHFGPAADDTAKALSMLADGVSVVINVVFLDGTSAHFVADYKSLTPVYVPATMRNVDGTPLPDSMVWISPRYAVTVKNRQAQDILIADLRALGVSVRPAYSSERIAKLACKSVGTMSRPEVACN
jgi:hypothetical protein